MCDGFCVVTFTRNVFWIDRGPEKYTSGPEQYTSGSEQYTSGPEQYTSGPEKYTSEVMVSCCEWFLHEYIVFTDTRVFN